MKTTRRPLRIGVTAVGGGVGQSIVDGCRVAAFPTQVIGLDVQPFAFGAYDCDEFDMMPRWSKPDFVADLIHLVRQKEIDLLIPGLDNELPILAQAAPDFEEAGVRVLIGPADVVAMTRNKVDWSNELSAISAAIVPSWAGRETKKVLDERSIAFPLISKPSGGSASAGVKVVRNQGELWKIADSDVVQPFVRPSSDDPNFEAIESALERGELLQASEISVQYVYGSRGNLLGRMASYNRLKHGVPIEIIPVDWKEIWDSLDPVMSHLVQQGIRGPVNVQGRLSPDGLRFFEMNLRFTGITGLRALMGFNEVEALIRDFADEESDPDALLTVNPTRVGVRQVMARTVRHDVNSHMSNITAFLRSHKDSGKAVAVTGASGWLGRHLVNSLLRLDSVDQVVALVRNPSHAVDIFSKIHSDKLRILSWHSMDSRHWNFGHADVLLHLAGARPPHGNSAIQESLRLHLELADLAARFEIPEIVYLSSQSVYGKQTGRLTEETKPEPDTTYATMKLAGEYAFRQAAGRSRSSRVSVIRLSRLYGSATGMRWEELPHRFALQAVKGTLENISPGGPSYDLININDAVRALTALVLAGLPVGFSLFNCASSHTVSIPTIADAAKHAAIRVSREAAVEHESAVTPQEQNQFRVIDSQSFRSMFNWVPQRTLSDTMEELVHAALSVSVPDPG